MPNGLKFSTKQLKEFNEVVDSCSSSQSALSALRAKFVDYFGQVVELTLLAGLCNSFLAICCGVSHGMFVILERFARMLETAKQEHKHMVAVGGECPFFETVLLGMCFAIQRTPFFGQSSHRLSFLNHNRSARPTPRALCHGCRLASHCLQS